jgi:hypothetical protein
MVLARDAGSSRHGIVLMSAGLHVGCTALTSFALPILMGSNIWPIAGVFWSALTVPAGALLGAGVGALVRSQPRSKALALACLTAIALSVAVGVLIWRNR